MQAYLQQFVDGHILFFVLIATDLLARYTNERCQLFLCFVVVDAQISDVFSIHNYHLVNILLRDLLVPLDKRPIRGIYCAYRDLLVPA